MGTPSYFIQFECELTRGHLPVTLVAEVCHQPDDIYFVRNIRCAYSYKGPVIPDMLIVHKDGTWLHIDSWKETDLSVCIGGAIEKMEEKLIPPL